MPTNITDVDAFTDPVQVPTDGDPVESGPASYLRAGLQALSNRTRYAYNLLTNGVQRVRVVASTVALKALAAPPNGAVAVQFGGTSPKFFIFTVYPGPPSEIAGYLYPADDGTGFWASEMYYLTTGTGASLRIDPTVAPVPNRIVSVQSGSDTSTVAISAVGAVFGPTLSVAVNSGDLVMIDGHTNINQNGASTDWKGTVYVSVNAVDQTDSQARWDTVDVLRSVSTRTLYTAGATGTLTVRLSYTSNSGTSGTANFSVMHYLRAMVIRP